VSVPRGRLHADVRPDPGHDERFDAERPQHRAEPRPDESAVPVLDDDGLAFDGRNAVRLGPPRAATAMRLRLAAVTKEPRVGVGLGLMDGLYEDDRRLEAARSFQEAAKAGDHGFDHCD